MTKTKHLDFAFKLTAAALLSTVIISFQAQANDLCQGLLKADPDDKRRIQARSMPEFGERWTDPAFGTTLIRLSDMRHGALAKPAYSTLQAWNADESLLLLYHSDSQSRRQSHELYDGKTYRHRRTLAIEPVDIEEIYWDPHRASILYYVSRSRSHYGKLLAYNVDTEQKTPLLDSREVCGDASLMTNGRDTMMPAIDQPLISLRCNQSPRDLAFVFNLQTRKVHYQRAIGQDTLWSGEVAPILSASGRYLWQDHWAIDLDKPFERVRLNLGSPQAHASIGRNSQGADRYYQVSHHATEHSCQGSSSQGIGTLLSHDLQTGQCRNLLPQQRWGYPVSGVHVSATAYKNPGWIVVSTQAYKQLETIESQQPVAPLVSEILLVKDDPLEPEPTVCRVAHTRSHGKLAKDTTYEPYFGEAHASLSPSGTRIIFGSDWHNGGQVNTYVIELPSYRR